MNKQLAIDFLVLPKAEQEEVRKTLNVVIAKGRHESKLDYAQRFVLEVDNAGRIRELEQLVVGGV
jgi:hypothetical protein